MAPVALFVLFQALYGLTSSGNVFRTPDEFEVYFQTEHLIDAGDLSVPQAVEIQQPVIVNGKVVGAQSMFFGKIGRDGKPYAPYGPLAAVLAVPHHLAGRALAGMMGIQRVPRAEGLAWVIFVGGVTMLATATAAALAVAGFYRASMALGTAPRTAVLLSLMLGGATVLWPYGTSFFSEAFLAASFIWAAAFLIEARTAERAGTRVALAALLILIAGLTKVTSLMIAPAFVVAVMAERSIDAPRKWRAAFGIGGAIALAGVLQLGWNAYRFGSPFDFGYDWTETIPVLPARAFALADMPRGLMVLLFSPGKSLFLWAPLLVIAMLNARAVWQRDRALAMGLLSAVVIGLLAYAAYLFPEGGYAHGPRHLVPIVPLLALAAAGPASRAQSKPLLYGCAAVGFAIALLATRVSYLEDQALRRDAMGRVVPNYYELIEPAHGRPNNRYRFDHIPFVTAMGTPGWSQSPVLGQGPDYFFKHLQQARRQLRDGQSIPAALPWSWASMWAAIALAGAVSLARAHRVKSSETSPAPVETGVSPAVTTASMPDAALRSLPIIRAIERTMPVIVVALAAILIGSELNQGWVPYDEGALGQAAERVLAGQVPHRDFDDIYTGGLAYLHAAFFSVGPHTSITLRIPLFLFAVAWVAALYAIARRFLSPIGAGLVTVTAVVWSVPNYPASMPSWFNLFFATFGALALLRGLEGGGRSWIVLAGVAGGISFLFKLSGIFYLLGGGIALIAISFRSTPAGTAPRARSGAALVSAILGLVFAALAVPITRAGTGEMARFLLPLGALFAALIWREWRHGDTTALERGRALFGTLVPFTGGALLPLSVLVMFLLWTGALSQTIDGVLIKPFRRIDSAMMHPPPPIELIYSIGIGLLLAMSASRRVSTIAAMSAAVLFAGVLYWSGSNPGIYAMGVLAAWGLPLLSAAGAAWLLTAATTGSAYRARDAAIVMTAIACATLLIEFPFASPSYLFYTIPLSMVALAAVVGAAGRTATSVQFVVVVFLLLFGLVRVNPGTHNSFGFRFIETDETVRMKLPKSGLRVRAADAARYEALIGAVQVLAKDRVLWAGPDAPEVYFLSGVPNRTRTLFDFLDAEPVPLVERVRRVGASLVVLNLRPDFSPAPDPATIKALSADFPNVREVPGFLVFWR
jgi:hypothetical protein